MNCIKIRFYTTFEYFFLRETPDLPMDFHFFKKESSHTQSLTLKMSTHVYNFSTSCFYTIIYILTKNHHFFWPVLSCVHFMVLLCRVMSGITLGFFFHAILPLFSNLLTQILFLFPMRHEYFVYYRLCLSSDSLIMYFSCSGFFLGNLLETCSDFSCSFSFFKAFPPFS